ncbi:MAG: AAA family ATPase [Planctomycetes bacterium]|nr:AAA family ATPase [Planctomycetota bacterium]
MPVDASERRHVVVLFAGLSDFAAAAAGRSPEDARDLLDELFARFRAEVEAEGGAVDKFVDDTVMALFGAPVAHADDGARAVRAAFRLQQAAREVGAERGATLALSTGINSGEVLWGSVGGDRPTAMGDPVNVAQRLKAASAPGTVLVSAAVARDAPRAARFRPVPPLHVRGRQEPVDAFEAAELPSAVTEFHAIGGREARLIGRDGELARLLARAVEPGGTVMVVEGEAGIGKSRLVTELRRAFRGRNPETWVAAGRALEGAHMPLGPFGDLLRQGAESQEARCVLAAARRVLQAAGAAPRDAENMAHLVGSSAGFAEPGARVAQLDPARRAAETVHAWQRWIEGRAAGRPALICLEDLHWADDETWRLLAALKPLLAGRPVALVGTRRPGAALPANLEVQRLGELAGAAAAELAEDVLGGRVTEELGAFLAEQTGGNPCFVQELAAYLREQGLVEGVPIRLRVRPDRIPSGLNGLLVARLDALQPEDKEAVKGASVAGREFWERLLSAMIEREAGGSLRAAEGRDLVRRQAESLLPGDTQFSFRHALLRDAAYSIVTRRERTRLHGRAAAELERSGGRRVRALAAGHHLAAGRGGPAEELWLSGAAEALAASAPGEALGYALSARSVRGSAASALAASRAMGQLARYEEALATAREAAAAPDASPADRLAASLEAGFALRGLSRFAEALEAAAPALDPAAPDSIRGPATVLKTQLLTRLARYPEAAEAAREARRVAARCGEEKHGDLDLADGVLHEMAGHIDAAVASYESALAQFRARGIRSGEASALINLGSLHTLRVNPAAARAALEEALELKRAMGDRLGVAAALNNLGLAHARRNDPRAALACQEEGLSLARAVGDRHLAAYCLSAAGNVHLMEGRIERARASYAEALDLRRAIDDRRGVAASLTALGLAELQLGDVLGSLARQRDAATIQREIGDRRGLASTLGNLAAAQSSKGAAAAAARSIDEAIALWRELGDSRSLAHVLVMRANAARLGGDIPGARALLEEALPVVRSAGGPRIEAEAQNAFAQIEAAAGRHAEAAEAAAEAARLAAACGAIEEESSALSLRARVLASFSPTEARAAAEAALARARIVKTPGVESAALGALARACAAQGDPDARRFLAEARAASSAHSLPDQVALACDEAFVLLAEGDAAGARQVFAGAAARARAAGAPGLAVGLEAGGS